MPLKQKTTLIIITSFLVLLTFMGLVMRFSVSRSFQDMEDDSAIEHVLQVKNEISDEQNELNSIVGDWSAWTDARDFALGDYPEYIDDNMMDASFTNLSIDFMWIGDVDGHELFAKTVDLERGTEIPFPDDLRQYINAHPQLTQFADVTESVKGIIALPEGLAILAAQPLRDSDNVGPIAGTFIMGKYLNASKQQELSEKTRLSATLYLWNAPTLPATVQLARTDLQHGKLVTTYVLDDDNIGGYAILNDIDGNPAAILETTQSRVIFQTGWDSMGVFFLVTTLIALGLIIIMVVVLDRMVLRRVTRLDNYMTDIARSGDLAKRLTVSGKDELSNLMQTLNGMMNTLQESDEALRNAHDQLEERVTARTAELTATLSEKNVLLKEVHHRVKNNLQIIVSLLNLQARNVDDPQTLLLLNDSQSRVRSMALVHEKLYQSEALDRIKFNDYLRELTRFLYGLYWKREGSVEFSVQAEDVELDIETAIPCGLLVNELITNSLKHAFLAESNGGMVQIQFFAENGNYVLRVTDNGSGFPADSELQQPSSLGMQLVKSLTRQLNGELDISTDHGTIVNITFPIGENNL